MSFPDCIDISSDEESELPEVKDVKPLLFSSVPEERGNYQAANTQHPKEYLIKPSLQDERSHNIVNGFSNGSYTTDQENGFTDGVCPASTSYASFAPVSRQFWKSGDYEARHSLPPASRNGNNRLRIHPKFLHSNATSHKWAFGAIAELLDNAVDEVQKGATFVMVDKFTNPRNGDAALLIQDDGGGMDPESLRQCMSFGFSDKQSNTCIGQYGNGFKTSTMRLGADVIVFSRLTNNRKLTQSVGLLSYTFLRQTACDDIVVPVVDYEFIPSSGAFCQLLRTNQKQFSSNLSTILRWSPFASETELLTQFNDIGHHGTKVIVFNLWYNDDGEMELDFEADAKDILINKTQQKKLKKTNETELTRNNIATRLQYSLRAYSSVLYLHLPETFKIILRGQLVMPHHIVNDLIYRECIRYRPQVEGYPEVLTTIGFLEGAPNVCVDGFNVYHRNRLILPFWRVAHNSYGKGRGVVGVLEANFIKPTHDKQDFEKSNIYQKLENRLKEMTYEYWDLHCHLLGYKSKYVKKPPKPPPQITFDSDRKTKMHHVVSGGASAGVISKVQALNEPRGSKDTVPGHLTIYGSMDQKGLSQKRKLESHISATEALQKKAVVISSAAGHSDSHISQAELSGGQKKRRGIETMLLENKKLRDQCLEFEEAEKVLLAKEEKLRREVRSYQQLHKKLLAELEALDEVKMEKL
ncbi:protein MICRORCHIDIA 6-like [Iris pallida]|uniref:Protein MICRORCHIDIA 6-like n=1 Tax=Iris pallida TaxID=29817 RepID=A0AAX6E9X3_IRIPA|nr:protein MICRORCHIDIA 6-like [Iris pallida]